MRTRYFICEKRSDSIRKMKVSQGKMSLVYMFYTCEITKFSYGLWFACTSLNLGLETSQPIYDKYNKKMKADSPSCKNTQFPLKIKYLKSKLPDERNVKEAATMIEKSDWTTKHNSAPSYISHTISHMKINFTCGINFHMWMFYFICETCSVNQNFTCEIFN